MPLQSRCLLDHDSLLIHDDLNTDRLALAVPGSFRTQHLHQVERQDHPDFSCLQRLRKQGHGQIHCGLFAAIAQDVAPPCQALPDEAFPEYQVIRLKDGKYANAPNCGYRRTPPFPRRPTDQAHAVCNAPLAGAFVNTFTQFDQARQ